MATTISLVILLDGFNFKMGSINSTTFDHGKI